MLTLGCVAGADYPSFYGLPPNGKKMTDMLAVGEAPAVNYPASEHMAETAAYRGPKGNLSFSHQMPLPLPLIARVAQALASEYASE